MQSDNVLLSTRAGQSRQGTLQRLSKKLGVDLSVARFVRLQCGEGLDNQKADFAAEVAAMTS